MRWGHPLLMNAPIPPGSAGKRPVGTPPRVLLTWLLLGLSVVMLIGRSTVEFVQGQTGAVDLALAVAISALVTSAVMNARAAGMFVERRHSEAESFSRIVRALSRSVSPDAVVEAIVHELGAATEADHVAVVRLRPGGAVLDVTFVSMLPGAPTSNTVMPVRQIEPTGTWNVRQVPHPPSSKMPLGIFAGEPKAVWLDDHDHGSQATAGDDDSRRNVRSRSRPPGFAQN
jgi:hypothetical protein